MFTLFCALPVLCHRSASKLGPSKGNEVSNSVIFVFFQSVVLVLWEIDPS
jgi:hypothetical protein